ncbi:hypothetical protein DX932_32230 [Bacillus cereus]|uniref:Uncharacterized protein n=1 Tax=Bacillus cereus TaxID=1396 RepID=A0A9W7PZ82_BACCE|nr:hypothetical protein [Bacillus cereus]KAA6448169.1 hypothetical protein DX932_32230 [Bacillus cereus]KAB2398076.1 hypothetical protein F8171_03920 [Bacillus cereus]KAB2504887.1 hypothetical protein F8156_07370 [Bacillus cereus]
MENTNSKPYLNTNEGVFTSIKLQEAIDQAFRIPVFLSTVNTLNQLQQQFLDRLIIEIEQALLFPRTIPRSDQYPESSLTSIRRMILSSYGLIAINFQRFFVQGIRTNVGPFQPTEPFWEGTPFSQIEPSMGYQYRLPLLLIREIGTDNNRGIWQLGNAPFLILEWNSETQSIESFFNSVSWRQFFSN